MSFSPGRSISCNCYLSFSYLHSLYNTDSIVTHRTCNVPCHVQSYNVTLTAHLMTYLHLRLNRTVSVSFKTWFHVQLLESLQLLQRVACNCT